MNFPLQVIDTEYGLVPIVNQGKVISNVFITMCETITMTKSTQGPALTAIYIYELITYKYP